MLKDSDKEEKALDALISVTLLDSSRDPDKRDRIIAEIEAIREEDVVLSRDDEIALERLGKSLFQDSEQSTYNCYSSTASMLVSEFSDTVYAMGRNGEDANLDEETKKEIEERRKRILEELNNKDKKDEKTEE
jgi:hypothetical protein